MKENNYLLIGTHPIEKRNVVIKEYKNLKQAMWDLDFFSLMFIDVRVYKKIVENGEQVK